MQNLNRPVMELSVNSKMAFSIQGVLEEQMSRGIDLPVYFLFKSLSESILYQKPPYIVC